MRSSSLKAHLKSALTIHIVALQPTKGVFFENHTKIMLQQFMVGLPPSSVVGQACIAHSELLTWDVDPTLVWTNTLAGR